LHGELKNNDVEFLHSPNTVNHLSNLMLGGMDDNFIGTWPMISPSALNGHLSSGVPVNI
jgi:hypothetical protein